jgi:hypothetical protein
MLNNFNLRIYDFRGALVLLQEVYSSAGKLKIPLIDLNTGIYYIVLEQLDKKAIKSFCKF